MIFSGGLRGQGGRCQEGPQDASRAAVPARWGRTEPARAPTPRAASPLSTGPGSSPRLSLPSTSCLSVCWGQTLRATRQVSCAFEWPSHGLRLPHSPGPGSERSGRQPWTQRPYRARARRSPGACSWCAGRCLLLTRTSGAPEEMPRGGRTPCGADT